jgi:hypothetical protein
MNVTRKFVIANLLFTISALAERIVGNFPASLNR